MISPSCPRIPQNFLKIFSQNGLHPCPSMVLYNYQLLIQKTTWRMKWIITVSCSTSL
ncbi:Hypothetical protein TRBEL_143 [Escherichia phage vB_Eco_EL]